MMNRFVSSLIFVWTAISLVAAGAAEHALFGRTASEAKLRPYVHCDGFAGGVRAVNLDRRPQTAEPWRAVDYGGNGLRVSVIDGYRVTYTYARTYVFANLKAEQSDPSRYAEDKRIVTLELAEMAKADDALDLVDFSYLGYSGQTLTKRALAGRALGKSQILSDEDAVIITIFFLNQDPENRRFQTHEEFVALRYTFIRGYINCVAKTKSAGIGAY